MAGHDGLACPKCGSRDTVIKTADELSGDTGRKGFWGGGSGASSARTMFAAKKTPGPEIFILPAIALATMVFDWMKSAEQRKRQEAEANRKILYCKKCGHWERV